MHVLAVLPFLCFLGLWALFLQERPDSAPGCWRTAFLKAAIVLGLLVWLGTELLSLFTALGREGLTLYWAVACLGVEALFRARQKNGRRLRAAMPRMDALCWILLACVAMLVATTGLVALVAPPNTWDSMTYHMSRVAHWAQNRSVAFYPTNIPRQNYLGPFAEFGILHLYVLWGGDRLANLVQWCCMIGSLAGVSLIAARLGAGLRGQAFAALICATIPMGILQASSTQTDYVEAFWLTSFVALILPLLRGNSGNRGGAALAGGALGLAVLTKGTAYLYGFPFLLWLAVARLRKQGWRAVGNLLIIAFVALGVNFPHFSRNDRLSGSPLGPREENAEYRNETFGPRVLASNLLRNAGLHFTRTISGRINRVCIAAIAGLHRLMGMDLNDPRCSWPATDFWQATGYSTHEDKAGNPAHAFLIAAALGMICFVPRFRATPLLRAYALCVAGGFVLFCFCLKWQPWNARLHLPLFVLASAMVARVLSEWGRRWIVLGVAAALTALAVSPAFHNHSRPLLGRAWSIFSVSRVKLYFVNAPELYKGYSRVTSGILENKYRRVGLYLGGDDWEYPLWVMLGAPESKVRLEHMDVTNASARLGGGFGPAGPDTRIRIGPRPVSSPKPDAGARPAAGAAGPEAMPPRTP